MLAKQSRGGKCGIVCIDIRGLRSLLLPGLYGGVEVQPRILAHQQRDDVVKERLLFYVATPDGSHVAPLREHHVQLAPLHARHPLHKRSETNSIFNRANQCCAC